MALDFGVWGGDGFQGHGVWFGNGKDAELQVLGE